MDKKFEHSLELITQALDEYERVALACSFGKDSMATLHLARKINPYIPVFTILTPFKPKETSMFMRKVDMLWNLNLKIYQSKETPIETLHKTDPDKCCNIFKVKPTMEALKNFDAWISGLRRSEGINRSNFKEIEVKGGLVKFNPILDWTEADVWRYTAINKLPIQPWYELGYRSLGCACCSQPNTEEERGGRWKDTSKSGGECGIHTKNLRNEMQNQQ